MVAKPLALWTIVVALALPVALVRADAAGDLADGRAALAAGQIDRALPLLEKSAADLPASVEAQFALGQAQLQAGQLDKALQQFRKVLALSPDHPQARRLADGLAGGQKDFASQLALAGLLIDQQAYPPATSLLRELVRQPAGRAEMAKAKVALAEALLWQNAARPDVELLDALRAAAGDDALTKQARVMMALAQVASGEAAQIQAAAELVDIAQGPQPWVTRAQIITGLATAKQDVLWRTAAVTNGMASIPPGRLRDQLAAVCARRLLSADRSQIEPIRVVYPMLTGKGLTVEPATLTGKFIDMSGGWAAGQPDVSESLRQIAGQEFHRRGPKATLLALWLEAEQWRHAQARNPVESIERRLAVVAELGSMGAIDPARQVGSPLSVADRLQKTLAEQIAAELNEPQARRLVQLIVAQLDRYQQAGDTETGLAQWVRPSARLRVPIQATGGEGPPAARAPAPEIELPTALTITLVAEPARTMLVNELARRYAQLGAERFDRLARSPAVDANATLNAFDRTAVELIAPTVASATAGQRFAQLDAIVNRYAQAGQWSAAGQALTLFYGKFDGRADEWARSDLLRRQVSQEEASRLTGGLTLPGELDPKLLESFALLLQGLAGQPESQLSAVAGVLSEWTQRYDGFGRADLADAVLALAGAPLADWQASVRAQRLMLRGNQEVARLAGQYQGRQRLTLTADHAAAIKQLAELLVRFPESRHAAGTVGMVSQIADVYRDNKAFDVADSVYVAFARDAGQIKDARLVGWLRAQVALAKAADAFDDRQAGAKGQPPAKLLDEHAAALDKLAEFIKADPTGHYSGAAREAMLHVAVQYGQAGSWPIAREVVARLMAASPGWLTLEQRQLIEAATYLAELNREHGVALLLQPAWPERHGDGDRRDSLLGVRGAMTPYDAGDGVDWHAMAPTTQPADMAAYWGQAPRQGAKPKPAERPDVGGIPGNTLAAIRQNELMQARQIAQLREEQKQLVDQLQQMQQRGGQQADQQIVLPAGRVLSEAEIKRQDAAADAAYAILIKLAGSADAGQGLARQAGEQARGELLWLVGFFEGQLRGNRAADLVERLIKDRPDDRDRVALAYRAAGDRLTWAAQRQGDEPVDQAWVDARHKLFEAARAQIAGFIEQYGPQPAQQSWVNRAHLLNVNSYRTEAALVEPVSGPRSAGLLARSADELLALSSRLPEHPEAGQWPDQLWQMAQRLGAMGQRERAADLLGQISVRYPTHPLAAQALLQIAELYSADLSAPLRAAETYQEYLSLAGDNESIRSRIFSLAQQLGNRQRYLEALHVYGVFVDSFPTDPRAAQALQAIGQTHQANGAWADAIRAYDRIDEEYPDSPAAGPVKLAVAECNIQLSQWRQARRLYEDYQQRYGQGGNPPANQPVAQQGGPQAAGAGVNLAERIEVLKSLDRYQTLLADRQVDRNKDDAQFQIARIVVERLGNRVKAIEEFRKVVSGYPQSHLADDAQFEIGQALMQLGRLDEAREELAQVPEKHPLSPLADDALYLIGQTYEQQAQRLAQISLERARQMVFESSQRGAYKDYQQAQKVQNEALNKRREQLKQSGKVAQLELEEAYNTYRYSSSDTSVTQFASLGIWAAENESALEVANRQDRINDAYRAAVNYYESAARNYPQGDTTDESLLRMAEIYETRLNDRSAAMATYQQVVRFFPGTPVAENAAWKVAKFYEQQGQYDEAVKAYREFIRTYPGSGRVADAQFALAEALEQLGRWVEAMDAYQTFRDKFANHPKAAPAQDQIQWIRAYRLK